MINTFLAGLTILILLAWTTQGTPVSSAPHRELVARRAKAREMLKYMNTSVDPCEDFYEYSCGNYANYHVPSDDDPSVGQLDLLSRTMDDKIILELQADNVTDTDWDKQVKNFYRSCLAAPELDSVYAHKMKDLIKEFGQMPALVGNSWRNRDFDWLETVGNIARKTNKQIIIGAFVDKDFGDNTRKAAILAAPKLSFGNKSFYVDKKFVKMHPIFIRTIAVNMQKFLGMQWQVAVQTAREIFEFEQALAHGLADDKNNFPIGDKYIPMKINDLQRKYLHAWDTKKLFDIVFGAVPRVLYVERKYMENAKEVLQYTSKRVIANYVFYIYTKYFTYMPKNTLRTMDLYCLAITEDYFYKNLQNLMYRRHFTQKMKEGIYSIWQDLQDTFEDVLQSPRMSWIGRSTRRRAIEKLQYMDIDIKSYEYNDFAKQFTNLELQSYDFIENMESLLIQLGHNARVAAYEPPQDLELDSTSAFSPSYLIDENEISVPASFLMPYYLWSKSYPYAYNFATLGFYLAHELVHGFDESGQFVDAEGNIGAWWDSKSVGEFHLRKQCFGEQYSDFMYNESPLSALEQDEHIADNGGVRLAFSAYLRWLTSATKAQKNMDLESLPGVDFTNRQLFFISYGQTWCNDIRQLDQMILSTTDEHMPGRFRAIGSLSNFEEFAKEFNCPKGSGMNPAIKCEIY